MFIKIFSEHVFKAVIFMIAGAQNSESWKNRWWFQRIYTHEYWNFKTRFLL